VGHKVVEWRGTSGLNHAEAWHLVDQANFAQLSQGFSEGGSVAQVPARQHDPVRRFPIALIQHFDYDALLPFNPKRIYGVEKIDAELFRQRSHQCKNFIEVRIYFERLRAVLKRLGELTERDIAMRQKKSRLRGLPQPRTRPWMPRCCQWRHRPHDAYPSASPAPFRRSFRCP